MIMRSVLRCVAVCCSCFTAVLRLCCSALQRVALTGRGSIRVHGILWWCASRKAISPLPPVTWHIYMCDMTHSHACHDSFNTGSYHNALAGRLASCEMTHSCDMTHSSSSRECHMLQHTATQLQHTGSYHNALAGMFSLSHFAAPSCDMTHS